MKVEQEDARGSYIKRIFPNMSTQTEIFKDLNFKTSEKRTTKKKDKSWEWE